MRPTGWGPDPWYLTVFGQKSYMFSAMRSTARKPNFLKLHDTQYYFFGSPAQGDGSSVKKLCEEVGKNFKPRLGRSGRASSVLKEATESRPQSHEAGREAGLKAGLKAGLEAALEAGEASIYRLNLKVTRQAARQASRQARQASRQASKPQGTKPQPQCKAQKP